MRNLGYGVYRCDGCARELPHNPNLSVEEKSAYLRLGWIIVSIGPEWDRELIHYCAECADSYERDGLVFRSEAE